MFCTLRKRKKKKKDNHFLVDSHAISNADTSDYASGKLSTTRLGDAQDKKQHYMDWILSFVLS